MGGERERAKEKRKKKRTEFIRSVRIRRRVVLSLRLQTSPQPGRIGFVRERDGVGLALEDVEAA